MTLVDTEQVLVIPTEHFHRLGHFKGFRPRSIAISLISWITNHCDTFPVVSGGRSQFQAADPLLCVPPRVWQMGPSCSSTVVGKDKAKYGCGPNAASVWVGTSRRSIQRPLAPGTGTNVYEEGLRRELAEEVEITTPYQGKIVGLINDDETEVGKVHLGIVHLFDVERPTVEPREEDILDAGFQRVEEILPALDEFESWSEIAVRALFGK